MSRNRWVYQQVERLQAAEEALDQVLMEHPFACMGQLICRRIDQAIFESIALLDNQRQGHWNYLLGKLGETTPEGIENAKNQLEKISTAQLALIRLYNGTA